MSQLNKELSQFSQRKLEQGEVVLLAYALANKIPLIPNEVESVVQYVIGYSGLIDGVRFKLIEHAHISDEQVSTLKELVGKFLLWRTSVAKGNQLVLFSGDANVVIDELTGLPRLVDIGLLCSLSEICERGNWVFSVFRKLVDSIYTEYKGNSNE